MKSQLKNFTEIFSNKRELFFQKMNKIYNDCYLFRGDFDGQKVKVNLKCYLKNIIMELLGYFFFINNLISFMLDGKLTDNQRIYLTSIEITAVGGFGSKYVNLVSNLLILLSTSFTINAFEQLIKIKERLKSFQFLFCEDVKSMQQKYHLNERLAIRQIKYQTLFKKRIILLPKIYASILFFVTLRYAMRNLSDLPFDLLFLIKSVICFLLFIQMHKSSFIIILLTFEFNLSCLYLSNHLSTLTCKVNSLLLDAPQKLDKKITGILNEYSIIVKNQKLMNDHFDRSLPFLQVCNAFIFIHPTLFLNENWDEQKILVTFYILSYLAIILFIYLPVVAFNSYFCRKNKKFVQTCYRTIGYLKNPGIKMKMENVFVLNNQPIIFSFKKIINYSSFTFIYYIIECFTLDILIFDAVNKTK